MKQFKLYTLMNLLLGLVFSGLTHASCEVNGITDTVIDLSSKLMWSQCLYGQSGKRCELGSALKLSWVDAVNKARGSEFAAYKNWRLPKIEEIETLLSSCSTRQQAFPGLTEGFIWSATGNLDFNTKAWAYNLAENKREVFSRDSERNDFHFLLVRVIE